MLIGKVEMGERPSDLYNVHTCVSAKDHVSEALIDDAVLLENRVIDYMRLPGPIYMQIGLHASVL